MVSINPCNPWGLFIITSFDDLNMEINLKKLDNLELDGDLFFLKTTFDKLDNAMPNPKPKLHI
jgi:hypothetical protein